MNIRPIRNDDDLKAAFVRLEDIFQAQDQTPEADERDVLVTLVEAYENKHYDFGPADPVEAIKFRMEQQGAGSRAIHRTQRQGVRSTQSKEAIKPAYDQEPARRTQHSLRKSARRGPLTTLDCRY